MVFVQKWAYFQLFFLGNMGQNNVFYDILEQKNAFLGYKKKQLQWSKNWHFTKGVNPCSWSKNGKFSTFFFLGNIGQDNVFYDILERQNAFLGYKNKKFKKVEKIDIFSKGLTHGFGPKNAHSSNFFFLGNMGQDNVYDILERKKAFQGYKNKKA